MLAVGVHHAISKQLSLISTASGHGVLTCYIHKCLANANCVGGCACSCWLQEHGDTSAQLQQLLEEKHQQERAMLQLQQQLAVTQQELHQQNTRHVH